MYKKAPSLKKFYAYFYNTGEIRKVMAPDLEIAYKIAEQDFGPASGNFTIGNLPYKKIPQGRIPIERSEK